MCCTVNWLVLWLVNLLFFSKTLLGKYSLSNECMLMIPSAAFYPYILSGIGRFLVRRGEGVSSESLCSGQWIVVELMVSTHTQWQSITQSLKHHLRLNVQCLLISSVVRDYKYRLINNIFPAVGNILSTGTKLRWNFWGLREMMETGLELFITCTYQDTEHGPNGSHVSYNWYSSQSKTRQEVDWCGSRK